MRRVAAALLTPSIEPPGQNGQGHERSGHDHDNKIGGQVCQCLELANQFLSFGRRPATAIASSHQQGHESLDLAEFVGNQQAFPPLGSEQLIDKHGNQGEDRKLADLIQ
jgi:hypothetical protein